MNRNFTVPPMDEKKQFAQRLAAAMTAAGYEPRPVVLETQFNSRYWGKAVTYQGARRWLLGMSIPEQDKLQVLADWLSVEPHVLRFGARASGKARKSTPAGIPLRDRELLDAYHALSPARQQLVHELVDALSRPMEQVADKKQRSADVKR